MTERELDTFNEIILTFVVVILILLALFLGGCAAVKPPKVAVYDGSVFPANTCEVTHGSHGKDCTRR